MSIKVCVKVMEEIVDIEVDSIAEVGTHKFYSKLFPNTTMSSKKLEKYYPVILENIGYILNTTDATAAFESLFPELASLNLAVVTSITVYYKPEIPGLEYWRPVQLLDLRRTIVLSNMEAYKNLQTPPEFNQNQLDYFETFTVDENEESYAFENDEFEDDEYDDDDE